MNFEKIEIELKKRLQYEYRWGRKQNDLWDNRTNFIYSIFNFEKLIAEIKKHKYEFNSHSDYRDFGGYALNRWYNFLSAYALEKIFCSSENVTPSLNEKDRLQDFTIDGISFDHKTSVFPKNYPHPIEFALNNKKDLISWLYLNQSSQRRMHFENRLFVVLYSFSGGHWKLKSEILWLKSIIENYLKTFSAENLLQIKFSQKNKTAFSDIIWAVR